MTDHPSQEASAQPERLSGTACLRLLPWTTPEGKACFLDSDGSGGALSQFADTVEEAQTSAASAVLKGAQAVLGDAKADTRELHFALSRVTEALGDMLRIAESRGARLPVLEPADDSDEDESEGPKLPAEAFG